MRAFVSESANGVETATGLEGRFEYRRRIAGVKREIEANQVEPATGKLGKEIRFEHLAGDTVERAVLNREGDGARFHAARRAPASRRCGGNGNGPGACAHVQDSEVTQRALD